MRKEKHIPTQAEVLEVLTELATRPELSNFKIGLFGSYARNNYNSRSDIDIIFREYVTWQSGGAVTAGRPGELDMDAAASIQLNGQ